MSARILTFDIETAPNLGYTWAFYEQDVIKIVRPWYVLTVGYKWLNEKQAHVLSLPDYSLFKKNIQDDKELIKDFWELLDKADIVVTQNGDNFDIKKLNTRFLVHGLPPPSDFKSIDTKKSSKKHFAFGNNKLGNLGIELGLGDKEAHEGFPLWERCMAGDLEAFKKMAKYNKRDVYLTESVYLKERPYIKNHPNINLYEGKPDACPKCGSIELISRGFAFTSLNKHKRYSCNNCGTWCMGKKSEQIVVNIK